MRRAFGSFDRQNPESDSEAAGVSWLGDAWLNDEGQVEADEAVGPPPCRPQSGEDHREPKEQLCSVLDGEVVARDGLRDVELPREELRDVRVP